MFPEIKLLGVTLEDVSRVELWLDDPEVNTFWYGVDEDQIPVHIAVSYTHLTLPTTPYV